ncbi:MAG: GH109, partial [uncultured Phycisphaerae bacterium]
GRRQPAAGSVRRDRHRRDGVVPHLLPPADGRREAGGRVRHRRGQGREGRPGRRGEVHQQRRDAQERHGRRGADRDAAPVPPGRGDRRVRERRQRAVREAGGDQRHPGQGDERRRRPGGGQEPQGQVRRHAEPADDRAVQEAAGADPRRRAGRDQPGELDHDRLVPPVGLLRVRRLAGHLEGRGRRGADQPV